MKFTIATTLLTMTALAVASPWAAPTTTPAPPPVTVTVTASAPPAPTGSGGGVSQCNTGNTYCCNEVTTSQEANVLLGLLGIVLGPIQGLVGVECSPLDIVGIGSGSCNASPACCTGNTAAGGLVNIGCLPINLNL